MSERAQRFNTGKTRTDLVPAEAVMYLAEVFEAGINKGYRANDWRKGMPYTECLASLERHFLNGNLIKNRILMKKQN